MDFISRTQLIVALGAVGLALVVLELVRRRKLAEEYSLLWMVASFIIAVLGFSTPILKAVTHLFGIMYESSMVFFVGLAFGTVMLLYLSVRLSWLTRNLESVAREIALLRYEIAARGTGDRAPSATEQGNT